MENKIFSIFVSDKEDIELNEFLDGNLTIDEFFLVFSISASTFYKRNKKSVFNALKAKMRDSIKMMSFVDESANLTLENSFIDELCNAEPNDFFNSFDSIVMSNADYNFTKTVIENNFNFFKGKNFILQDYYGMTREDAKKLKEDIKIFKGILPDDSNILVRVSGNSLPVSEDEYFKSYNIMEDVVTLVKSLNLTDLEKIMFVYDIVKKRVFTRESENECSFVSRDLTSSLIGDKIVCVGFNIIFETILNLLGISTIPIRLEGYEDESGHVRTCIYVDDSKYNCKGHFFFDVTWDSSVDSKSPNSYKYFLKTLDEMIEADRLEGLHFADDLFLYPNFIYQTFRTLKDEFTYADFIALKGKTRFNRYLKNLGLPTIELDINHNKKSTLISAYKSIYDSFNDSINPIDFAELLYNVKRLEYYIDPEGTPFSENDLAESILGNTFSKFNRNENELNLLSNILGISVSDIENRDKKDLLRATITPKLTRDIRGVKLTRMLRETLLKK